jgi:hypothetical protein
MSAFDQTGSIRLALAIGIPPDDLIGARTWQCDRCQEHFDRVRPWGRRLLCAECFARESGRKAHNGHRPHPADADLPYMVGG